MRLRLELARSRLVLLGDLEGFLADVCPSRTLPPPDILVLEASDEVFGAGKRAQASHVSTT